MEEQISRRKKYAVMVVKEQEDGSISSHHIGTALCEFLLVAIFIIFVFFICKLIYDGVVIKDLRSQVVDELVQVNDLTDENESLRVENDTLTSKVAVLSETVTKKTASEDALSQEEVENSLPKGFPLSGSATMTSEEMDGHPIVKFTASNGVNIVSAGAGTILSVEDDAEYGNRVIIDHGNGYKSIYRNANEVLVKAGETLGKGYILFSIGDSNQEVGYQIMSDEEYIDPTTMMDVVG